mmetsp:Transcript_72890/g.207654  ORF Transcript_72890/g.207654 Transcript_72890/m.207654 type:complete len:217 (-) Transcript_72890:274-924(-)
MGSMLRVIPGPCQGLGRAMVCRVAAGRPRARLLRPPRALSTAAHPNSCWRCGAGMAPFTLTCERCSPPTIQPMAGWPLFELFDTEPAVRLDLGELERAFKNLQRKLHPDLFHQRSEVCWFRPLVHAPSSLTKCYHTSQRGPPLVRLPIHPVPTAAGAGGTRAVGGELGLGQRGVPDSAAPFGARQIPSVAARHRGTRRDGRYDFGPDALNGSDGDP